MDSIVQASMHDSSTQWTELITRLKQSLLVIFDFKINEMEESLRTMVSQRNRNGWDFQEFFIQKVCFTMKIIFFIITSLDKQKLICLESLFVGSVS
jgi:hypothetical protein